MYLSRQDNTLYQERRSFHSPAQRTLPWSRKRFLHDTDTTSRYPFGTLLLLRTPSHCGHTWEKLRGRTMLNTLWCGWQLRLLHSARCPSYFSGIISRAFSSWLYDKKIWKMTSFMCERLSPLYTNIYKFINTHSSSAFDGNVYLNQMALR